MCFLLLWDDAVLATDRCAQCVYLHFQSTVSCQRDVLIMWNDGAMSDMCICVFLCVFFFFYIWWMSALYSRYDYNRESGTRIYLFLTASVFFLFCLLAINIGCDCYAFVFVQVFPVYYIHSVFLSPLMFIVFYLLFMFSWVWPLFCFYSCFETFNCSQLFLQKLSSSPCVWSRSSARTAHTYMFGNIKCSLAWGLFL